MWKHCPMCIYSAVIIISTNGYKFLTAYIARYCAIHIINCHHSVCIAEYPSNRWCDCCQCFLSAHTHAVAYVEMRHMYMHEYPSNRWCDCCQCSVFYLHTHMQLPMWRWGTCTCTSIHPTDDVTVVNVVFSICTHIQLPMLRWGTCTPRWKRSWQNSRVNETRFGHCHWC